MFYYFFKRQIKDKYLGNITGFAWVFIQPLITLLIYWFVFDKIFQNRIIVDNQQYSFIVYLAIGFWPWLAFSESVITAITTVSEKSELIGKIKLDLKIPVIASITATFLLHMLGYIVVLIGLVIFNESLHFSSLIALIFPISQMYLLAITLGLFLSALQIFIKDTLQLMTTLMTLWFFLTPIIYSEALIPEKYMSIIQFNPLYIPITFIHKSVLGGGDLPWLALSILFFVTVILMFLSVRIFDKLAVNFEDYK